MNLNLLMTLITKIREKKEPNINPWFFPALGETSCTAVCSSAKFVEATRWIKPTSWVGRTHCCRSPQTRCSAGTHAHACGQRNLKRCVQKYHIHTSLGGFPLLCSLSHSPPLLVSRTTFSQSHLRSAAIDCTHLTSDEQNTFVYCAPQSGSHYSCEAAARLL